MIRKTILGVFVVMAIVAGLTFNGQVSAQERDTNVRNAKSEARLVTPAAPQSMMVEDFSYSTGQLTAIPGVPWVSYSGTGNFIQVSSGGLTYPGYPSSGIGNKIDIISAGTSAEDVYRQFATQGVGTTTYAALMVNITNTTGLALNTSATGDYFAGFLPSSSTTALVSRVSIRLGVAPNTFNLGLRASSSNAATSFSSADLNPGTTYLVVISYQGVSGATNDVVNMWINPTLGGAEPPADLSQVSALDSADIARFFVRQGTTTTPNASVDGVRVSNSWASIITPTPAAALDFNGDGKTDWAITRANGGLKEWWIQMNGSASSIAGQFGLATDRAIPADYDGDGKTDIAVWREAPATQAAFYIYQSSTGTVRTELFGQTGDSPKTVADYDGDGKADVSVYRPGASAGAQSYFYYRGSLNNPSGIITYVAWGINGDTETVGDFDGDGKGDFCVRRNISGQGTFILLRSSDLAVEFVSWGLPTDVIIPGDYDGDGKSDFCVARDSGGTGNGYILQRNGGGTGASPIVFANPALDLLAPGDYDGDGKTDIAVWRANADPTQNFFWVRQSSNLSVISFEWGQAGDEPPAEWNVSGGD